MQRITVIDYGMGNLHSVSKALAKVAPDDEICISNDAHIIAQSDRLILPGVGAMRDCIAEIKAAAVDKQIAQAFGQQPMLCICVGMQALMQSSAENGGVDCLGYMNGQVHNFSDYPEVNQAKLKIPHMGWNQVNQSTHPIWHNIADNTRFYFVHSYFVKMATQHEVVGQCNYGLTFDAAVTLPNVFAVQFHPEKSHTAGLQLLHNFVQWDGGC